MQSANPHAVNQRPPSVRTAAGLICDGRGVAGGIASRLQCRNALVAREHVCRDGPCRLRIAKVGRDLTLATADKLARYFGLELRSKGKRDS
jgi:hypothetical protein